MVCPLFVEELTKAILESGHLKEVDGHYALVGSFSTLAIPATLQDSLMARLDRLVTAKAVAQYAAVIGRQFAYDVLSTVSQLDEVTLQRELGRLVEAEIVYQRGVPPQATYMFKHALIQDAAYASLFKSTRQHYHQRIAQVLRPSSRDRRDTARTAGASLYRGRAGSRPCLLATGRPERHTLGQSRGHRHLTKGLEVLTTLPETPCASPAGARPADALGTACMPQGPCSPRGGTDLRPGAGAVSQVGDTPQLFPVLRGLCQFYLNRGVLQTPPELGEQLLAAGPGQPDPPVSWPTNALGDTPCSTWATTPQPGRTWRRAAPAMTRTPPAPWRYATGTEPGCRCLRYAAQRCGAWALPTRPAAEPGGARLAQELAHPLSLASAPACAAVAPSVAPGSTSGPRTGGGRDALATEQGFATWVAFGTCPAGLGAGGAGQGEAGMAQIPGGRGRPGHRGRRVAAVFVWVLLAEVSGVAAPARGLRVLAEARGN